MTDILPQKLLDPLHSFFIGHLRQSVFHRINSIKISKIHLSRRTGLGILIQHMDLLRRSMEHDFFFLLRQVTKRHIRPHAHIPRDILHQRPHQGLPRQHCALLDGKRIIRNQGRFIHHPDNAGSVTGRTRTGAVKGQFFCGWRIEMLPTLRADQFQSGSYIHGRFQPVSIRTNVAGQTRKHQTNHIEQFRRCAKRAAHARHARPLMQRQSRRNITQIIHLRLFCLCHTASGISRKCLQITPRALRV